MLESLNLIFAEAWPLVNLTRYVKLSEIISTEPLVLAIWPDSFLMIIFKLTEFETEKSDEFPESISTEITVLNLSIVKALRQATWPFL